MTIPAENNEEIDTDVVDSEIENNDQSNAEESNAFSEAFDDKSENEADSKKEAEQEDNADDKDKAKEKDAETDESDADEQEEKEKTPTALELAENRAKELKKNEPELKLENKSDKAEKQEPAKKETEAETEAKADAEKDKAKKTPAPSSFRDVIALADEGKQKVLKKALNDFPELEGVFDTIFDKLGQNAIKPEAPEKKPVDEPKVEKELEKAAASEKDTSELEQSRFMLGLAEKMPDAVQIANDEKFHTWLGDQSAGIQKLAGSFDVDDALMVLNAYKEGTAAEKAKTVDEGSIRKKKNDLHKTTIKGAVPKSKDKSKDDFSSGFDLDDDED